MRHTGPALVALAACVALCPSEAILHLASSCCTQVSHNISRRLLRRVNTCYRQKADGDCNLAAIVLHVKHRRLCMSPDNRTIKRWIEGQATKKNAKGHNCDKRNFVVKGHIRDKVHGHQALP